MKIQNIQNIKIHKITTIKIKIYKFHKKQWWILIERSGVAEENTITSNHNSSRFANDIQYKGSILNIKIHHQSKHNVFKKFLKATLNWAFSFLSLVRLSSKLLKISAIRKRPLLKTCKVVICSKKMGLIFCINAV